MVKGGKMCTDEKYVEKHVLVGINVYDLEKCVLNLMNGWRYVSVYIWVNMYWCCWVEK